MRYFYSLFSKNLRLAQNLRNEVFVYNSDFKVDIPYKEKSHGIYSKIKKKVRPVRLRGHE